MPAQCILQFKCKDQVEKKLLWVTLNPYLVSRPQTKKTGQLFGGVINHKLSTSSPCRMRWVKHMGVPESRDLSLTQQVHFNTVCIGFKYQHLDTVCRRPWQEFELPLYLWRHPPAPGDLCLQCVDDLSILPIERRGKVSEIKEKKICRKKNSIKLKPFGSKDKCSLTPVELQM